MSLLEQLQLLAPMCPKSGKSEIALAYISFEIPAANAATADGTHRVMMESSTHGTVTTRSWVAFEALTADSLNI